MRSNEVTHLNECTCLSWKPVIAGTLAIIGLSFLLNLFSVAIGLTAFTTGSDGVETLVMGGLLGTAIGIIASMFASGWLAGYLAQRHCAKRHLGALYGFLAWCLALIIAVFISAHIQQYISFYGHVLSGTSGAIQMTHTPEATHMTVAGNEIQAKHLVISTYVIFVLFFLSAFACSLGGHCGMRHVCKKEGTCA